MSNKANVTLRTEYDTTETMATDSNHAIDLYNSLVTNEQDFFLSISVNETYSVWHNRDQ